MPESLPEKFREEDLDIQTASLAGKLVIEVY